MNKDELNIKDLSDGEFLLLLYKERERENNLRKFQGWNLWALLGALIAVVCYCYHIIVNEQSVICISQVIYYVSGFLAFVLCYRPLSLFFEKSRGVDYNKVKTLKDVVPIHYIWLSLTVSLAFSLLVPLFNNEPPFSVITIAWMISFALFLIARISVFSNRYKIVKSYLNKMIFTEIKWEMLFAGLTSAVFALIWYDSFKIISRSLFASTNFEVSICISVIVLLLYFLIKVWSSEKSLNEIDILIEDYLYKGLSREFVFKMLRIKRMGRTALESCSNEFYGMLRKFDIFQQNKGKIESIRKLFLEEIVEIDKVLDYWDEIDRVVTYLKEFSQQADSLIKRMKQYVKQVPEINENKEFVYLMTTVEQYLLREEDLLMLTTETKDLIKQWMEKYHCEKYGGFCKTDCKHRHEKRSRRRCFFYKTR